MAIEGADGNLPALRPDGHDLIVIQRAGKKQAGNGNKDFFGLDRSANTSSSWVLAVKHAQLHLVMCRQCAQFRGLRQVASLQGPESVWRCSPRWCQPAFAAAWSHARPAPPAHRLASSQQPPGSLQGCYSHFEWAAPLWSSAGSCEPSSAVGLQSEASLQQHSAAPADLPEDEAAAPYGPCWLGCSACATLYTDALGSLLKDTSILASAAVRWPGYYTWPVCTGTPDEMAEVIMGAAAPPSKS